MKYLGFEDLNEAFEHDLAIADARQAAVHSTSQLVNELTELGFAPIVRCTKNDESAGLIMLTIDLAVWGNSGGDDGCVAEPPEPPAETPSEPAPERVDVKRADQARSAALGDAAPVPDPKPPKKKAEPRKKEAEVITGPIEGEERELVLSMFAEGMSPSHVARQLGRKTKQLANFKFNHKEEIAQAMQQQTAPEPEAQEQPEPAPSKTEAVAQRVVPAAITDNLTGPEREINAHLNAVGYAVGWSPVRDLRMAQALGLGDGAGAVANELGVEKSAVVERWKTINQDPVSIDHQRRLVRVLRLRAKGVVEAAE